jgi:hypothetical protein
VTIEQASTALGSALFQDGAGIYSQFQHVVFIAHSTGGIVLRRILVRLRNQGQAAALQRVGAVVFFAVPTAGAPIADLARWLSANPQLRDLSPAEMMSYLGSVDNDWEDLLRQRDVAGNRRPLVYCAYEVLDTAIGPIVPTLYSRTRCDEAPRPFDDRDHSTLVKPINARTDNVYAWTKGKLQGIRPRAGQVLWDGGETLGALVERLQSGFQEGRVPEQVRFAAGEGAELSDLWVQRGSYKRDNWGELLRVVAATHSCLQVDIVVPGRTVELRRNGPVKRCRQGRMSWNVCGQDACTRRE